MALTLKQNKVINDLSKLCYNFLPGNPHPYADQRISYRGIADEMGLLSFWPGGSKTPAITTLLECTYEFKRDLFCNLILEIVRRGMKYTEITKEEIIELNNLVFQLDFKIPELWDQDFLNSLNSAETETMESLDLNVDDKEQLDDLHDKLLEIGAIEGPNRGFAFEKYLNEMFRFFDLKPKKFL